jgi:hypothetical protein
VCVSLGAVAVERMRWIVCSSQMRNRYQATVVTLPYIATAADFLAPRSMAAPRASMPLTECPAEFAKQPRPRFEPIALHSAQ